MSQPLPLPFLKLPRATRCAASLLLATLSLQAPAAPAQYVGKVAGNKQPVLRAVAVYQYTGSLLKPNASRLVPVAVWDGEHYQPGGLYLARPEPLAVAPGTQYVLLQSGMPQGLFDVGSAAQANGAWVGLGRTKAEVVAPAPKLKASWQLPVLTGGSGKGQAGGDSSKKPDEADNGPVLHRKTESGSGNSPSGNSTDNGPTLHRRDTGGSNSGDAGDSSSDPDRPTLHRKDTAETSTAPAPDPDRPTLHRKDAETTASGPPDPDRPTLHRHADPGATTAETPDPDRPHLRYGAVADDARAQPVMLTDKSLAASPSTPGKDASAVGSVALGQAVAISDTRADEPRSWIHHWASPQEESTARAAMHALALGALAGAVQNSFGPAAAGGDAALRRAARPSQGSFGPGAHRSSGAGHRSPASVTSAPDPLLDPEFSAWELSYGGSTTYVYSAHTALGTRPDPIQRYVTVIAVTDFAGKPQLVFSQTTRSDTLSQTPILHLIDAVDTNGDGRAELLFNEQTTADAASRAFAIYSVAGGKVVPVYSTELRSGQ